MTDYKLSIGTDYWRLGEDDLTCLLVPDGVGYQKGDRVRLHPSTDDQWWSDPYTITHVIKNRAGLEERHAVLCLRSPLIDHYHSEIERLQSRVSVLLRSQASLRGVVTKLRKRLGSSHGV